MKKIPLLLTGILILWNGLAQQINAQSCPVFAPVITSFTPTVYGGSGSSITITGKYFFCVDSVNFDGVAADSFTVISTTKIVAYPADPNIALSMGKLNPTVASTSAGTVSVNTAGGGTVSMAGFQYLIPLGPTAYITSFSPKKAVSGTTVTIYGSYLGMFGNNVSSISFGGVFVFNNIYTSPDGSFIQAQVPAGASGDIVVYFTNGGDESLSGFIYLTNPTLTTNPPANVSKNSATISGDITLAGDDTILHKGVVYNKTGNPTLSGDAIFLYRPAAPAPSTILTGTGPFSEDLTGLESSTTYYARTFAINSVDTGYGSQVSFTTLSATLPIVFNTISAQQKNNYTTNIAWGVAVETGIKSYTIENSVDGINFNAIGTLENNNSNLYSWNDTNFAKGINYYRVKAVGIFGEITYSKTVSIVINTNALSIYPNPAHDYFIIGNAHGDGWVCIKDLSGKTILTQKITNVARQQIDIRSFAKGMYVVTIITKQQNSTQKIEVK